MYFLISKILAPFFNATNLLIFLIFLSYFINLIYDKKYFKSLFKIFVLILLVISFFPIGHLGLKFLESNHIKSKKNKNIENIIILAGSEAALASHVTQKLNLNNASERLIAGVKLGLEYPNAKIYFLGGDGNLIKNQFNEVDVAKLFFNDVGFNLNRIIFIGESRNTIENLKSISKIKFTNKNNVLITSAFHMNRAMLIAKKLEYDFESYPVDFRSINNSSLINSYQSFDLGENLIKFNIFFREILGTIYVRLFL